MAILRDAEGHLGVTTQEAVSSTDRCLHSHSVFRAWIVGTFIAPANNLDSILGPSVNREIQRLRLAQWRCGYIARCLQCWLMRAIKRGRSQMLVTVFLMLSIPLGDYVKRHCAYWRDIKSTLAPSIDFRCPMPDGSPSRGETNVGPMRIVTCPEILRLSTLRKSIYHLWNPNRSDAFGRDEKGLAWWRRRSLCPTSPGARCWR
jgi:hypothetical protein